MDQLNNEIHEHWCLTDIDENKVRNKINSYCLHSNEQDIPTNFKYLNIWDVFNFLKDIFVFKKLILGLPIFETSITNVCIDFYPALDSLVAYINDMILIKRDATFTPSLLSILYSRAACIPYVSEMRSIIHEFPSEWFLFTVYTYFLYFL